MQTQPQTPISNRGFDAQNLGGVAYCNQLSLPGLVTSVDNVRIKFVYRQSCYDRQQSSRMDTLDLLLAELTSVQLFLSGQIDIHVSSSNFRIGNYRYTVQYDLPGNRSFVVLLGRYCTDASVKQCAPEAILDFNPNKVDGKAWKRILGILGSVSLATSVQRFDLAIDLCTPRHNLELKRRNNSGYEKFVSPAGAITEYTGKRSHHAAIKLYDKAEELAREGIALDHPLTRLEITIEPKHFKSLKSLMPTIHAHSPLQLSLAFDKLPFEVQAVILHPDLYDRLKASVSHNTWSKYRKQIEDCKQTNFRIPDDQLDQIEKYVRSYIAMLPNAHQTS